jgi:hypothetical protein
MVYPPPGWTPAAELGAPPPPQIIRTGDGDALHAVVPSPRFERLLQAAAHDAATAPRGNVQRHLWTRLDHDMCDRSAAAKVRVQAAYLEAALAACVAASSASQRLAEWVRCVHCVGRSMATIFAQGVEGWNVGNEDEQPWWPFERYDRTSGDVLYANCFSDEQRVRDRVRVRVEDDACVRATMMSAHRTMLAIETKGDLFATLPAPLAGGLFLLTMVADNWPKQTELFGVEYWTLRAIHFGIERNTLLRARAFDLRAETLSPSLSPLAAPAPALARQQSPNAARSHCWLQNALDSMIALKCLVFYRLRLHLADRRAGRPATTERAIRQRVLVDRHDVEESKLHWLPAQRRSTSTPAQPKQGDPDGDALKRLLDAVDAAVAKGTHGVETVADVQETLVLVEKRLREQISKMYDALDVVARREIGDRMREIARMRSQKRKGLDDNGAPLSSSARRMINVAIRDHLRNATNICATSGEISDIKSSIAATRARLLRVISFRLRLAHQPQLWIPQAARDLDVCATKPAYRAASDAERAAEVAFAHCAHEAARAIARSVATCACKLSALMGPPLPGTLSPLPLPERVRQSSARARATELVAHLRLYTPCDDEGRRIDMMKLTPEQVVEHWTAVRRAVAFVTVVEPWVRDPRRAPTTAAEDQKRIHAEYDALWPRWPPVFEHVSGRVGPSCAVALLRWGRLSGLRALHALAECALTPTATATATATAAPVLMLTPTPPLVPPLPFEGCGSHRAHAAPALALPDAEA